MNIKSPKELDEFVFAYGFDNKVHEENKPMSQAMLETERNNRYAQSI